MEKYTKDVVTNALQVVDAAVAQFKGTRQEHELIINSVKVLVDLSNKYLEENKVEENPHKPNVVTLYVNRFRYKPLTVLNQISLFAAGFLVSSLFWILLFKHK